MNEKLLEYIKHLSETDKKSLSDKTLKIQEEVGELAKVVLPYTSAYATNHRFVEKERILEEAVDTILCALSVAYDLRFTHEEIESMMKLKSEKWALLQKGEEDLKFPIPFEIHITVQPKASFVNETIDYFREVCADGNVKPIILDLETQAGKIIKDVMTSSVHFGDNASAYNESQRVADHMDEYGYKVVRVKIETVPWHPASPKSLNDEMPKNCYFEAHIPIIHKPEQKELLERFMNLHGLNNLHLSSNTFKKHTDGTVTTMLTYRTYKSHLFAFEDMVQYFTNKLSDVDVRIDGYEWSVGKVHKEFSIYDTKISHDAEWLRRT